jgi:phage-related minor tail protein
MKNRIGLLGEAGPEAILPLKRGPGGRLGVESSGGGGNVTVEINQNFALGVTAEVRAEFAAQIPRMVQAAQVGVAEAARRGGRFRKAIS